MSVYVDKIQGHSTEAIEPAARKFGHLWCHCWADATTELIVFCQMAGWPMSWLRRGHICTHVDLVPSQRRKALRMGAIEKSLRTWYQENRHVETDRGSGEGRPAEG